MADSNEIRISSNLTGVFVVTEGSVTLKQVDANVLSVGGLYKSMIYNDADACIYKSGVLKQTTATLIGDTTTEGGAGDRTGTVPSMVRGVAVKFESALGSPGPVVLEVGGTILAVLDVGEGYACAIAGSVADAGLAIAGVKLWDPAYSNGVHEATITFSIVGL